MLYALAIIQNISKMFLRISKPKGTSTTKIQYMQKPLHTSISLIHICKTSLLTVLGMISFFFLMELFNMNSILELRYLNFVFIFFGVRHVLLHKQNADGIKTHLHSAMMIGFLTVFLTSAMFSAFIFSYLNINTTFMLMVKFSQPFGQYLSPASAAFVTFLEGVASGAIVAIPVLWTMKKERTAAANEAISQFAN
jgi:hypothetical protein